MSPHKACCTSDKNNQTLILLWEARLSHPCFPNMIWLESNWNRVCSSHVSTSNSVWTDAEQDKKCQSKENSWAGEKSCWGCCVPTGGYSTKIVTTIHFHLQWWTWGLLWPLKRKEIERHTERVILNPSKRTIQWLKPSSLQKNQWNTRYQ